VEAFHRSPGLRGLLRKTQIYIRVARPAHAERRAPAAEIEKMASAQCGSGWGRVLEAMATGSLGVVWLVATIPPLVNEEAARVAHRGRAKATPERTDDEVTSSRRNDASISSSSHALQPSPFRLKAMMASFYP
jgi:hypothetical protein